MAAVTAALATAGCVGGDSYETTEGPARAAEVRVATYLEDDMTEIPLLVTEQACASGRSAEGRIEILDATLTDTELRVDVGVVPFGGDQNCPGNPETPFTLVLDEPLGPRDVVDANSPPDQPILLGTRRRVPRSSRRSSYARQAILPRRAHHHRDVCATRQPCPRWTGRHVRFRLTAAARAKDQRAWKRAAATRRR